METVTQATVDALNVLQIPHDNDDFNFDIFLNGEIKKNGRTVTVTKKGNEQCHYVARSAVIDLDASTLRLTYYSRDIHSNIYCYGRFRSDCSRYGYPSDMPSFELDRAKTLLFEGALFGWSDETFAAYHADPSFFLDTVYGTGGFFNYQVFDDSWRDEMFSFTLSGENENGELMYQPYLSERGSEFHSPFHDQLPNGDHAVLGGDWVKKETGAQSFKFGEPGDSEALEDLHTLIDREIGDSDLDEAGKKSKETILAVLDEFAARTTASPGAPLFTSDDFVFAFAANAYANGHTFEDLRETLAKDAEMNFFRFGELSERFLRQQSEDIDTRGLLNCAGYKCPGIFVK